jgi:hypothetical protein
MKVDLVSGDDWSGLYIENKLMMENHSLNVSRVLQLLSDHGIIAGFKEITADEDWLEERGRLPEELNEVVSA